MSDDDIRKLMPEPAVITGPDEFCYYTESDVIATARAAQTQQEAVMRQALEAMQTNQRAVADNARHVDVMAYNAAIAALREKLGDHK